MGIGLPAPQIYLIGGPNGAGKTTFARHFLPAVGITEFLNADSIAAGLSPLDPPAAGVRAPGCSSPAGVNL
jgi:predicted ABC-type ATPase